MLSLYTRTLKHFVSVSAGPLLIAWAMVFGMEWWLLRELATLPQVIGSSSLWVLTSWQVNELDGSRFFAIFSAIVLVWGLKTSLLKPSFETLRGIRPPTSVRVVFGQAIERIPSALGAGALFMVLFIISVGICLVCNVVAFTAIQIPLAVALGPMIYFVVARRMRLGRALLASIDAWRRHGTVMLAIECVIIMLIFALDMFLVPDTTPSSLGLSDFASFWGALAIGYVNWIGHTALYLAIDKTRETS